MMVQRRGHARTKDIAERNYNIKSAILNWASAWNEVKTPTLVNCWNKLFFDKVVEYNFEGCETNDYHQILLAAGEIEPTVEDIHEWLDREDGDPGYQIQTDEDIACDVLASITTGENSTDEEEEEQPLSKSKL
ncbi:hypothetical protein QE152_g29329 [Popillia japonica]|uniref:DDE-1 domain-containing protein n=1 Tax=Popillia japonica TaxID=7064 RepID=A0AAW1JHD2_POPJA